MVEIKRITALEFEDILARTTFNRGKLTKNYFLTLL